MQLMGGNYEAILPTVIYHFPPVMTLRGVCLKYVSFHSNGMQASYEKYEFEAPRTH